MAETSSTHVIQYISDISDIQAKVKKIQNINTQAAKRLGKDFSKAFDIVDSRVKKLSQSEIKLKSGKTQVKTLEQIDTTLKTVDGGFLKVSDTVTRVDGNIKKVNSTFTQLKGKMNATAKAQQALLGKSSKLSTNFSNLTDVNKKFGTQLRSFGTASKFVGTTLNTVSDSGSKVSKIFQTTNGKFVQLTETTKRLPNGIRNVSRSLKKLTDEQGKTITTFEGGSRGAKTLGQNFSNLAKRAALTIPVWFAIRQGISSVVSTIKNGITAIADFDRSLQKARRNLQGTSTEIESNFARLREEVTALSLETGVGVEAITNAFQKFATTGLDFETSMAGAINATKLAVTTFGETEDIANGVARAFRVLKDSTAETEDPAKLVAILFAQLNDLWEDNAFEIGEITKALERFSTVARNANFTTQQTVSTLAALQTAGVRGTRAGRLLSTAVIQLEKNFGKINKTLGLDLNPQLQNTFERFLLVVDAIGEINKTDSTKAVQAINDLFGGVRGGLPVQALVSLNKELKENLKVTGDLGKFQDNFEEQNEQINRQIAQIKNLNKEIGKAFTTGLLGGEDFTDTLAKITVKWKEFQGIAEDTAIVLRNLDPLKSLTLQGGIWNIIPQLQELDKKSTDNFIKKVDDALKGKLGKEALKDLIKNLRIEIDKNNIKVTDEALGELEGELRKILAENPLEVSVTPKITGDVELTPKETNQVTQLILKNQLEILKSQGATNAELLKAEKLYTEQLGIKEEGLSILDRELQIQRAINDEQGVQNKLSSDSVKLFRIAQEEGTNVAKRIAESLKDEDKFVRLLRQGGKEAEILKKQFAGRVEQVEAQRFFRGETVPGQRGLQGGTRIPIDEQLGGETRKFNQDLDITLTKALDRLKQLINPPARPATGSLVGSTVIPGTRALSGAIGNEEARRIANQRLPGALASVRGEQDIKLTIKFPDGETGVFFGSDAELDNLLKKPFDDMRRLMVDNIKNQPESPEAQAVDTRIDNF